MCKILLSINPEHVENILNGKKKYEFRKTLCKRKVDKIIIYSTYPIKKVVGEADVEKIIIDSPQNIWDKTKKYAGINKEFFNKYYSNKNQAIAYKLTNVIEYKKPITLKQIGVKQAPQSYIYLD